MIDWALDGGGWRDPHGLSVLGREECRDLLAEAPVGRLAFCREGRATVLPVSHVVDAWDIAFRSSYGTKLQEAARGSDVTFEADAFDPDAETGWSVLAVGPLEIVRDQAARARLQRLPRAATAPGAEDGRWVRITIREISGRRLDPPRR